MKTLKANFRLIGLAWKGSKAWVIGTAVNAMINSPRNLIIDVLLVGTIYNFIQKGRDFSGMVPLLAALALFYLLNLSFEAVLYGRIRAVGNHKICYSIDRMLCGNAARMPLSSYDDAAFYEEYIFALRNCPDMAKEAVENLSYLIGFLLGGLISMGLIASIQPVMLIFIGISILVSFGLSSLRQKLDLRYRERLAGVQVREQYVHRVFYMKDYAKELRSLPGLRDFLLGKFQEVERENMELAGEYGRKNFLLGILDILNKQTLMYWLIMLLTIVSIWRTGDIAPGSLLIMTTSVATAALLIGAIVGYLPALKKTRMYYEKLETFLERGKREDWGNQGDWEKQGDWEERKNREKKENREDWENRGNRENQGKQENREKRENRENRENREDWEKRGNRENREDWEKRENREYQGNREDASGGCGSGIVLAQIDSICFEHVTFTYPGEERPALRDVSFSLDKGEALAIVGLNGAGKSTILKLMLKFYPPDSGRILVNGHDLAQIDAVSYRQLFGCVFQEVNLYAMSARMNIAMEEGDSEKVRAAAAKAGLSGLFSGEGDLERQMTRELSGEGMVLSGGNAQKMAIARALYQDSQVLLLDEVTSAIDAETEQEIMACIAGNRKDRLTVMISHKLSCVKDMDRIIVLEDGKITETGSHARLMAGKGGYFELFRLQSEQFVRDSAQEALEEEAWL